MASTNRAHIYCRVSTGQQEDGYGLDVQEAECRQWCAERGLPVASCVHETWSGKDRSRPELDALIRRLELGDVVLCHRTSRLSRGGPLDTFLIKDRIQVAGASLRFVQGDVEDDETGELMLSLHAWKESRDRDQIVRQTQAGLQRRVASGRPLVGGKAPYGYRWADAEKSRLDLDPETAPIVRMIFDWALSGLSLRGIVSALAERGIPSPMGLSYWALTPLRELLLRPTYSGTVVSYRDRHVRRQGGGYTRSPRSADERVLLPGIAPAIVTADEQAAVAARLATNKANATRNNRDPQSTLLRAGFVRCGHCGNAMVVERNPIHGPLYRCCRTNRQRHNCPIPTIIAKHIDPLVWARVSDVLRDPDVIAREVERRREDGSLDRDLAGLSARIDAIERKQANTARAIAAINDDGAAAPLLVELRMLAEQKTAAGAEREQMQRRITDQAQEDQRVRNLESWCSQVGANLDTLTYEEKRLALDALGMRVAVYRPGAADEDGNPLPRWTMTMAPAQPETDGIVYPTRQNRITPSGVTITTQADADALPEISHANEEFKHEVQQVNLEFATGYAALYAEQGRAAVEEIGPNPVTSFNPESVEPTIGEGVRLGELVRIVGDVRLGDRARVGQRSALRADEGTPIIIGRNARIGGRVTFHALDNTDLIVSDNATIGNECVLHGPLRVGNNLDCEDGSVLFRATVEDNVTLREGATVVGEVILREGTIVPERAVVENQVQADALPTR